MNKLAVHGDSATALARPLEKFISAQLGEALQVRDLRRLTGGSSHDTWSFDVVRAKAPRETLCYVLRREFKRNSNQRSLDTEFALLRSLAELALPIARPVWCATNEGMLGSPFMVMERVAGVDLRKHLSVRGDTVDRRVLGLTLVRQQAAVHGVAIEILKDVLPVPRESLQELTRWTTMIDAADGANARPLLAAAIRWLRATPPDLEHLTLVHGDFKTNNLILTDGGQATILDWELAHWGDPVEDLAWTLLWTTQDDLVGGLLSREAYLSAYTDASGVPVDAARLFYWELFARVKLAAIFIDGAHANPASPPVRPFHALLGRALPYLERDLARMLERCFDDGVRT